MADGQYKFSIGLDNKQLELDVAQAKKAFDSLVKQAQQAGVKIDNIPNPFENIGKSAPQVAQATQQFNGLNMATQQLVRELPAASMGLNTFFLAISNNLPIFADQVKNLRQQGTSAAGVLKGIGSALFSWQTALVLGVTALSMYGKEIGAWISSLFKGKEAADALKDAQNGLNEEIAKNGLGIGKEIGKYESLRREFEAINGDLKEQERFVRDNQSAFDDLGVSVNSVIDAEDFFSGEGTEAFLKALRLRAEAMAAQKLAVEQYEKAINLDMQIEEARNEGPTFWDRTEANLANWAASQDATFNAAYGHNTTQEDVKQQRIKALEEEKKATMELVDSYFDLHDAKQQEANDTLKTAGIEQSNKERERQREAELRAAELRAKQIADASARLMSDAERKATQAKVDAMKEGIQKTIAQINHNYDLEEQAITKREEELKKLRGGRLTSGEQKAIDAMRKANASERDRSTQAAYDAVFAEADAWLEENNSEVEEAGEALNKELTRRTKAWEDYFLKYGTIKERLLAVTTKYNRLINDAETEAERMSLEAERDAILAQYEVETSAWAEELVGKTREQLNTMIDELIAEVEAKEAAFDALDSSTGEDAANYRKQIATLNAQIAALKKRLGEAYDAVSSNNWAEATQVFQNIGSAATDAADGIAEFDEGLADALRGIAQLASSATNMIGAIQGVMTAFKEGVSGIEKASAILAVVGAAIQAVSTLITLFKGANEVAEAVKQFKALNAELEVLNRLARIDSIEGTIFGGDSFSNFVNNLDVMRESMTKLQDSTVGAIEKINEAKRASIETMIAKYAGVYPDLEAYWRQQLEDLGKETDLTGFIEGIEVQLSKRKKSTLGDMLPELFGDGEVTLDALKKLQKSDVWDKISEGNRDMIDQMIRDWEAYEQATEAVNKYMQDIFGDLGASITDSLVDAFRNGTDAVEAMGDAVGNVVEQIATDMAHAAFIQPLLEQAQDGIEALNKQRSEGGMSDEEYMRELMGITSTLMGNAQDAGEGMAAYLDTMRQMAKEMGIDVFESDSAKNSTHAKGFQTMSQETGSELNGRFTDIQGQTHRIADAVEFMKGLQVQHTQHMQSVSSTLASIHTNTTLIEQHTRELSSISADINVMRRAIDNGAI